MHPVGTEQCGPQTAAPKDLVILAYATVRHYYGEFGRISSSFVLTGVLQTAQGLVRNYEQLLGKFRYVQRWPS